MEKVNYQKKLEELVKNFTTRPTLLLHSCCGPCSTEVISFLKDYFKITVFYYNPNIEPLEEYEKRKKEQLRFIKEYQENNQIKIDFLDYDYDHETFSNEVDSIKQLKEGGPRCLKCYNMRLTKTAKIAKEKGFDYFGTTLTVSPHKNSQDINILGEKISENIQIPFIYGDFKKNDGYQKSIKYSKDYNLYRQNYCGCLYGKEIQ